MNIIEIIANEKLMRPFFRPDLETWKSWTAFFKVLSGYKKLSSEEMRLFTECTGLEKLPTEQIKEVFLICGRRSGKSSVAAILSVYYALWGGWEKYISPGEKVRIFIIATNMAQAKYVKDYIKAIFDFPVFRKEVEKETLEEIYLRKGPIITIKPASWRSSRGASIGILIMEELAYWRFEYDSATCDKEIYIACKPGMTMIKNSLIIGLSTPFTRQGLLFEKFNKHWGKPGPVLVWRSPTWKMNLTLSEQELRDEFLELLGVDVFNAEFGASFREDIENYLPSEILDRAIPSGVTFREYQPENEYFAFCDPAEGLRANADSMAFAIAHAEGEGEERRALLDLILEFRPPFNPTEVISEIAEACKQYRVDKIIQDRVSIGWIADDFSRHEILVEVCDKTKSQIYELFAIAINKNLVTLLESDRMRHQFLGLQKFLKSGGLIKIDHLPNGHDDVSNVVAGACVLASQSEAGGIGDILWL